MNFLKSWMVSSVVALPPSIYTFFKDLTPCLFWTALSNVLQGLTALEILENMTMWLCVQTSKKVDNAGALGWPAVFFVFVSLPHKQNGDVEKICWSRLNHWSQLPTRQFCNAFQGTLWHAWSNEQGSCIEHFVHGENPLGPYTHSNILYGIGDSHFSFDCCRRACQCAFQNYRHLVCSCWPFYVHVGTSALSHRFVQREARQVCVGQVYLVHVTAFWHFLYHCHVAFNLDEIVKKEWQK